MGRVERVRRFNVRYKRRRHLPAVLPLRRRRSPFSRAAARRKTGAELPGRSLLTANGTAIHYLSYYLVCCGAVSLSRPVYSTGTTGLLTFVATRGACRAVYSPAAMQTCPRCGDSNSRMAE